MRKGKAGAFTEPGGRSRTSPEEEDDKMKRKRQCLSLQHAFTGGFGL